MPDGLCTVILMFGCTEHIFEKFLIVKSDFKFLGVIILIITHSAKLETNLRHRIKQLYSAQKQSLRKKTPVSNIFISYNSIAESNLFLFTPTC